MDTVWIGAGDQVLLRWNWTEFCGVQTSMRPLNPGTHDLGICFQQLCLQVPVLALMAILSAYHCGKRGASVFRGSVPVHAINLRLFFTACLALLPLIRAYIILTNTTTISLNTSVNNGISAAPVSTVPPAPSDTVDIMDDAKELWNKAKDEIKDIADMAKTIFYDNNTTGTADAVSDFATTQSYKDVLQFEDEETSAKPIDYLVAGTEGLAWVVHFCFLFGLRFGYGSSPRGPVTLRALLFLLIGVSALLLHSHVSHVPKSDVLPNLSLGFSISVVTLLSLYTLTLIPGTGSQDRGRSRSEYSQIGERTALLNTPSSSYIRFLEEQDPSYLGTAMENVNFLSKLLFHWVTPLMQKGVRGLLNHPDDLYDLPEHVSTTSISHEIDGNIIYKGNGYGSVALTPVVEIPDTRVVTTATEVSLIRLLHRCFGWQFYAVGILKFVADCMGFMGPMLLNRLVGFVEDKDEPLSYGYLYAVLLFGSTLIGAFCNAHFNFWMSVVGLKIRATIITLVYRKTLYSSNVELNQEFTFGEIVNFMSTDSDRIVNSCPSFHTFWSIPLQLAVTLYLLYNQIGVAFLAGVAFAVILIPINKVLANKIGQLSTKLMEYKDQRVRLMGEALRGMSSIKLNVWEEHFLRSIFKLRESEINYLRGRKYLDALCVYFWATTPVLISILTFTTYVLLGNELDAKTVFTSMALLNMLISPLNAFPWVLNGLTEAWVSVKRIQRLLNLSDLDTTAYYSDPPVGTDIMLQNAELSISTSTKSQVPAAESTGAATPSPNSESANIVTFEPDRVFSLQNLNLTVKKGQLIGIMGKVGSGKTMLLEAILAEITKDSGIIAVNNLDKGFGYVKQNPWVQRGTVRDNILFGKAYDHNRYKNVLTACALTNDLDSLPRRDLTGIGEAGNTLSGGQKTRITLARAVYADKDIYLLDDVLASLDQKVAKFIFENVIMGLLKNKTRILCTHHTQFLVHADSVLEMSKGRIIKQGYPSDILSDLEDFLLDSESMGAGYEVVPAKDPPQVVDNSQPNESDPLLDEECAEKGTVRFNVYTTYLKSLGHCLTISIFLAMILMQSSRNITDLWLSFWVTHMNTTNNETVNSRLSGIFLSAGENGTSDVSYYLTIYGILAFANSAFTLGRAFIFAYGGLRAAVTIHKQLLRIIMKAKTSFFDVHPLGRILNRFSSDTYTIDDSLPFIANILLAQLFGLIGTIIITTYGLPWILLILAPLVPMYHWLQNHYRLTSRELKRLSSTTLSPVYNHFNETLQGLSSIRAFRVVPRFKRENELFLEANQKSQFASIAAAQWLSLRLQFIGVALLGGVAVIAVVQHQFDIADPGLIGLAIAYALSVTGLLSGVVNAFTETEREMIAVERVKQYLECTPSENAGGDNPPYAWPSQGVVEFREAVLKYRDHLPPSLKGVSFMTRPAEKIGVVGRTGAGKSSILVSLFRLTEISYGEILIDNVNIGRLKLNALRSRLSIIPQDPFLFSGTVRENVDPLNQYPDSQVYKALERCMVHSLVYRMGGLGALLEEGGNNLSAGQRQLFCLVRAVLHNAKILCIDEATANVDEETDKCIQTTIRSSFRSATVITIAHRIRTIMHCDRVLVMGDGEVLEFDEPDVLMQDSNSYFHKLASQEFSDLE